MGLPLTIIREQLPETHRENIADITVLPFDYFELGVKVILYIEGRVCVPRQPKKGI